MEKLPPILPCKDDVRDLVVVPEVLLQTWNVRLLCAIWRELHVWDFPSGSAPYWRLYWNDRPGATVTLGRRTVEQTPDLLLVIPPNTPFVPRLAQPVRHLFLHFLVEAPDLSPTPGLHVLSMQKQDSWLLSRVAPAAGSGPAGLEETASALALVHAALARLPKDQMVSQRTYRPSEERIRQALARLEELPEEAAVRGMARHAGMSVNRFIEAFRLLLGQTPKQYLLRQHLDRACLLLHHTDRTIDDIAEAVGFGSRHHFTRAFTKYRGMGPAAFRHCR